MRSSWFRSVPSTPWRPVATKVGTALLPKSHVTVQVVTCGTPFSWAALHARVGWGAGREWLFMPATVARHRFPLRQAADVLLRATAQSTACEAQHAEHTLRRALHFLALRQQHAARRIVQQAAIHASVGRRRQAAAAGCSRAVGAVLLGTDERCNVPKRPGPSRVRNEWGSRVWGDGHVVGVLCNDDHRNGRLAAWDRKAREQGPVAAITDLQRGSGSKHLPSFAACRQRTQAATDGCCASIVSAVAAAAAIAQTHSKPARQAASRPQWQQWRPSTHSQGEWRRA